MTGDTMAGCHANLTDSAPMSAINGFDLGSSGGPYVVKNNKNVV
jgi:hypothetical protein